MLRPEPRPRCGPDFPGPRAALHHGDVQNPAEPPPSVAPSVVAPRARCRNVCLLRVGYASRPRLSPRLTLGGLALPRKPRVHGGRVTLSSLATHASILTPMRSTAGRPPASPPMGSSPTDSENQNPAASVSSLAPCIVGACPLDQCAVTHSLNGWLLLSQHPGCLGGRTSFATRLELGDLSGRSGLFPSRAHSLAHML